jgi:hypothetical protein
MGGHGGEGRADDFSYARVVDGENCKTSCFGGPARKVSEYLGSKDPLITGLEEGL